MVGLKTLLKRIVIMQICQSLSASAFAYLVEVKSCQHQIGKSCMFMVCLHWVFVVPLKWNILYRTLLVQVGGQYAIRQTSLLIYAEARCPLAT